MIRPSRFSDRAQLAGRPSIVMALRIYSENKDLPAFVAMVSQGSGNPADQPLYDRLWGSGFLPSRYRSEIPPRWATGALPVEPPGLNDATRRRFLTICPALIS
jgi:hypothetical protein